MAIGLPTVGQETTRDADKRKLAQFNERYVSKNWREFRNGQEVAVSAFDMLLEKISRDRLGDKAKKLYDDVLAIFKAPTDETLWLQYFYDFPKKFSVFCEVFCTQGQGELGRGCGIFMDMLDDIIKERPGTTAGFLLGLAKDTANGPGDEEAMYLLNHTLVSFICEFYDLFISEFNKLGTIDQDNVIRFVCYAEGTCFSIKKSDGSCCITNRLKEKNNTELLKRFRAAAEKYDVMWNLRTFAFIPNQ